jgi:hypothetical protein
MPAFRLDRPCAVAVFMFLTPPDRGQTTVSVFPVAGLAHRSNVVAPVHHIFKPVYQLLRNSVENTRCQPVDNPVQLEIGNGQIITYNKTGTA